MSMLASAHAPVGETWEAQPGSQQTSGHGQQAPRTSAGIDFTLREREVSSELGTVGLSLRHGAVSNNTRSEAVQEQREERGQVGDSEESEAAWRVW